jgi:hypothetical protein
MPKAFPNPRWIERSALDAEKWPRRRSGRNTSLATERPITSCGPQPFNHPYPGVPQVLHSGLYLRRASGATFDHATDSHRP